MKPTLNEKFIAYLTLLSGLSLSAVAVYYSVVGLTAIFAAAVIPIIIMGTTLEISKLVATIWLKQNWKTAPLLIKTYLFTAIVVLMIITSMGIFGFLSKAHSDQNLVSGDVMAKIAVYDEKIKTSKENIDVSRKQLKQMDEAVDQVMGRSADEKGADKAVALRRGQAKDRARLLQDIEAEQKTISSLNEERAPIAAEVRKVEAEVGPIKYIAAFFYGSTDPGILEKAVTWVIITLIVVFDPLAVILLLASQMSFQEFREREGKTTGVLKDNNGTIVGLRMPKKEVEETPTVEELKEIDEPVIEKPQGTEFEPIDCSKCGTELVDAPNIGLHCPNPECGVIQEPKIEDFTAPVAVQATPEVESEYVYVNGQTYHRNAAPSGYVQNEEQKVSNKWTNTITSEEYLKTSKDKKA
jgi:predicted Zn-ribbon and HTH transcriptional regulator